MNIRSLTRGDGVVIGAAVVLFIASFLDLTSYGNQCSGSYCANLNNPSAWDSLGTLMGIYLAGVIGAALITVARALPQPRKVVGLDMAQFGVAFTIFAAWTGFWTLVDASSRGAGLILGFIAALVLAGAAVAGPLLPALKGPLLSAPKPAAVTPSPYGVQAAGAPGQGYGYPGAQAQQPYGTQPQPGHPQPAAFGAQAGHPGQPQDTHQPTAAQPQPSSDAPAGEFAPFWFAVPVARPLYGEDGSPAPIAELAPGTWYLAVEQRGPGLIAQTQDGRRGVLQDTTGIQRG